MCSTAPGTESHMIHDEDDRSHTLYHVKLQRRMRRCSHSWGYWPLERPCSKARTKHSRHHDRFKCTQGFSDPCKGKIHSGHRPSQYRPVLVGREGAVEDVMIQRYPLTGTIALAYLTPFTHSQSTYRPSQRVWPRVVINWDDIPETQCPWEGLAEDVMVEIFQRVGLKNLLSVVPNVCRLWYNVSLNLDVLKFLDFGFLDEHHRDYKKLKFREYKKLKFIKSMVDRSHGVATHVFLPKYIWEYDAVLNVAKYISDGCPALKVLRTSCLLNEQVISKWKYLEELSLTQSYITCHLEKILNQINTHCKEFITLNAIFDYFREEEAYAIVNFLPKIKRLRLTTFNVDGPKPLALILACCKQLQLLDVSCSDGFQGNKDEIMKLCSHIKKFKSRKGCIFNFTYG